MEEALDGIRRNFRSGQHKAAQADLQALIETSATEDYLYEAYELLGDLLDFQGKHEPAVEAWKNALSNLEQSPGGLEELNERKLIDWINISIRAARVMHRQGMIRPCRSFI
jgi:tetratricopeptide (TPR) repeat protein